MQELVDSLKADPNQFGDVAHRQTLTVKSSYNRSRRERHRDLHRSALSRRAALGIHPQETSRGGSKRQLPFTQCLGSKLQCLADIASTDLRKPSDDLVDRHVPAMVPPSPRSINDG